MDVDEVPASPTGGRLAGRIAVVAGAGSPGDGWSIGGAVAALIAREGASVFLIDHSAEAAERTRAVVDAFGRPCAVAVADMTRLDDVRAAIDDCVAVFDRIDILYNNVGAGAIGHGGVAETTEEMWRRSVDLNLNSAYFASHCVLPVMRRQGSGTLIHLSSVAAIAYMHDTMAAYSAAKAGLIQMSRTIAMQHVDQGIRSNCVIAGSIETAEIRRRAEARFGAARLAEVMALRNSVLPGKRSGTVWDVAYAVLYLASDEARYVTATELLVDGGAAMPHVPSYHDRVPPSAGAS